MWLDLPDQGSGAGDWTIVERRNIQNSASWPSRTVESVPRAMSPRHASEEAIAGLFIYRLQNGIVEYLLLKKVRQNDWSPPKGHVESGEDSFEGAERETEEETGLVGTDYQVLDRYPIYFPYTTRQGILKRVHLWAAKYVNFNKPVQLSPEHDEFQWLDYESALAVIKPQYRKGLRPADLVIRTHESL